MSSISKKLNNQSNSIYFEEILCGQKYQFKSKPGLFSKDRIDKGTKLLIENMEINSKDTVLDLGCGYGPIGVVAAKLAQGGKVYLSDTDIRAVSFAQTNLHNNNIANAGVRISDGFNNLQDLVFDVILTNPPNHAPKETMEEFIKGSFEHLSEGGKLYLVSEMRLVSYMERILKIYFKNVEKVTQKDGYILYLTIK